MQMLSGIGEKIKNILDDTKLEQHKVNLRPIINPPQIATIRLQ